MRILCDIGLATAKAVTGRELTAAAAAGAKGGAKGREAAAAGVESEVAALARRDHPAQVVLPKKLYTLADRAETKSERQGLHRGIRRCMQCIAMYRL